MLFQLWYGSVLLGHVWEKFARPDALFFYLYHRSLDQFSDKSKPRKPSLIVHQPPNIPCENRSNRTFRSYHDYGQGPTCSSDKGRCRCALSNLNIAMEYTGEGFLFGFVAARHRSSARRFEISYLCACAEVIVSVTMHRVIWGSPLPFVVLCCRLRALPAELPW